MKIKLFVVCVSVAILLGCSTEKIKKPSYKPGEVMVARISSDGNYVVTGGDQNSILLWHIPTRTYEIISTDGNGFSPYFIKNSNEFLWQGNKDNVIHVQTISGKTVMQIPAKHKIYSDAMTSDKRYFFMSDFKWLKYRYDTQLKKWKRFSVSAFGADEKPLNMILDANNAKLLTSGSCDEKGDSIPLNKSKGKWNLDCIVLWDVKMAEPIKKFGGNLDSKVYATISPSNSQIIVGSEGGSSYIFSTDGTKRVELSDLNFGEYLGSGKWNKKGLIKKPIDFLDATGNNANDSVFSFRFITRNYYFRFTSGIKYLALYKVFSKLPKKYMSLGQMPYPSTVDYSRDGSIDTSIKTHTLVTGQAVFDGINVYKFDPKTETLYRVWSPILNKPPTAPKSLSKDIPTLPGITFDQLSEVKRVDSYPVK